MSLHFLGPSKRHQKAAGKPGLWITWACVNIAFGMGMTSKYLHGWWWWPVAGVLLGLLIIAIRINEATP